VGFFEAGKDVLRRRTVGLLRTLDFAMTDGGTLEVEILPPAAFKSAFLITLDVFPAGSWFLFLLRSVKLFPLEEREVLFFFKFLRSEF